MAKSAPNSRTPIEEATSTSNHVSSMLVTDQVSRSEKLVINKLKILYESPNAQKNFKYVLGRTHFYY